MTQPTNPVLAQSRGLAYQAYTDHFLMHPPVGPNADDHYDQSDRERDAIDQAADAVIRALLEDLHRKLVMRRDAWADVDGTYSQKAVHAAYEQEAREVEALLKDLGDE